MDEKCTILIVEDEEINRGILRMMLQDQFHIIEAVNGEDGIIKLRENIDTEVAAILLDLVMPETDGFYFLEEYGKSEELQGIPVIVSTMNYDDATETRCLKMGAWDFIRKPYNADIIQFRIRNCIERSELYVLKELRRREDYDKLTNVYRKNKFFAETRKQLDTAPEERYVFIRFDIHKFQLINRFYGMDTGDQLIQYIAKFIEEDAASGLFDTYGRIEADVFCLFGHNFQPEFMEEYETRVRKRLTEFGLDFEILPVFGVYRVEDTRESVNDMYDKANLAAKRCKGNYMDNFCFYEEQMSADIVNEQMIVNNMNHALEAEEFVLYLQPKYEMMHDTLEGAEVLVRWQSPQRGMISPGDFIPIFEHNGFIMKLDYYVWEQTCKLLKKWLQEGKNVFPVSVNISRVSLYNPRLVDIIDDLVHRYEIPPYLLQLELTETAYTNNPVAISEAMKKLQERGFVILMDDFGSGYSSLNVLKDISVDILKIDMKFLADTDVKGRGENILASVVRMAKWLNMPVIAEGVEKEEQVTFLKSIGCEYVQGYYFAKPMPVSAYEKLAFEAVEQGNQGDRAYDFSGVNRDKDALWNAASQMENLFSNMMQAVAICEYNGETIDITRVNKAYYNMFGYEDMSFSNMQIMKTVEEPYRANVLKAFQDVRDNQGESQCEYVRMLESGQKLWVQMKLKYIDCVGNHTVVFASLMDITEQKKLDLELQKYRSAIRATKKEYETLLIVDDQEMNRTVLRCIFEESFQIYEASNGEEALAVLSEHSDVDLILLDLMMPVMDGSTFLKEKKHMDEIRHIPVVVITADDTAQQQIHTLSLGANDYIVKPFIPETVRRRVRNVLDSTKSLGVVLAQVAETADKEEKDETRGG